MASSNHLFFLFVLLLPIISPISSDNDLFAKECGKTVTNNDILQGNINKTILELVAKTSAYGFANSSHGVGDDAVYGIADCRGDVSDQTCSSCIINAAQQIQTTCPNVVESHIWYRFRSLRYSTKNFFGQLELSLLDVSHSANNVTNLHPFKHTLNELSVVLWLATSFGKTRKFGLGEIRNPNLKNNGESIIIYGTAHCTWDLDESTCIDCLSNAFNIRDYECGERTSCYVITKSCDVGHDINPFPFLNAPFNSTKMASSIIFGNI